MGAALAYMAFPPSLFGWQYGLGLALTLSAVIGLPMGWLIWRFAVRDQRALDRLNWLRSDVITTAALDDSRHGCAKPSHAIGDRYARTPEKRCN